MIKLLKWGVLLFPAALFFSYHPVISIGSSESMNVELSLALIYLALFDVVSFVALVREKRFAQIFKQWKFLLFPIFATMSVFWSSNLMRGALTVVMLWAVYFAIMATVTLKDLLFEKGFSKRFYRWFFGASLVACGWCFLQCILDVAGVGPDCTLLCRGCVNGMFGFPHPNGFAVEPQFMGNLLLAPTIVSLCLLVKNKTNVKYYALSFVLMATVFLTFSRGAIYAMGVAAIFLTVYEMVKKKNRHVLVLWPVMVVAFAFTLNLQGVMAEVGPTSDNYLTGVTKVLNQLSLGVINIKVDKPAAEVETEPSEIMANTDPMFDGYVEQSTNVRMSLTNSALKVWRRDATTILFGVGLGGAGEALYAAGETGSPKEIVQNEYASLLLEIGVIGVLLVLMTVLAILKLVVKLDGSAMILSLIIAYAVTLFFFSGLPNALHIYIMPVMLSFYKKH